MAKEVAALGALFGFVAQSGEVLLPVAVGLDLVGGVRKALPVLWPVLAQTLGQDVLGEQTADDDARDVGSITAFESVEQEGGGGAAGLGLDVFERDDEGVDGDLTDRAVGVVGAEDPGGRRGRSGDEE